MTIQNNKKISITTLRSRKDMYIQQSEMLLSELVVRLQTPVRSPESYDDYLKLPKTQQDDLKDVGGFVGGTFSGRRRFAKDIEGRDLVTLDLDTIPAEGTSNILKRVNSMGCFAVVYSTRKHHEYAPRLRVIIPMDMTMEPDEYEPIARKLASMIGIEHCDPTTFETSRLMYWPSVSAGGVYVCEVFDKPFCQKFEILKMYSDWTDVTQWPVAPTEDAIVRREQTKQQDPLTKKGIIGAFCRTYTIPMAIARFLPGVYESTDMPGRLTYAGGSTTGGAVLYQDDRFLFSHHATDPCSGKLVNAWDLVRMHKFAGMDDDVPDTAPNSARPSHRAMQDLAMEDDAVRSLIAQERVQAAAEAFSEIVPEAPAPTPEQKDTIDWTKELAVDRNGNIEKTIDNVVKILENDQNLKGKIVKDDFGGLTVVLAPLPWDKEAFTDPRRWGNDDDAAIKWYLEKFYRLRTSETTEYAIKLVAMNQSVNTVRNYLTSLKWDGVNRLDTLFVDYLGAEDTPYTRAVARKTLCAACARAVCTGRAGVKFDYMPILIGGQGIGKSTLVRYLGLRWFSDSLVTFSGKDASEMLQGIWINEVGELAALTKYETNEVKQFLTKQVDIYRPSYGRVTEDYPRRCVFIGTSNESNVLKDITGNRRFWPIDTEVVEKTKNVWDDLPGEVDQIWAEAYFRYQLGEGLYMDSQLEAYANKVQRMHEEEDDMVGVIAEWLDKPVPKNWDNLSLASRKSFWAEAFQTDEELVPRDKVCAREVYFECLGRTDTSTDQRVMKRINGILMRMPGWVRNKSKRRYGPHGTQRGYEKVWTYQGGGE